MVLLSLSCIVHFGVRGGRARGVLQKLANIPVISTDEAPFFQEITVYTDLFGGTFK